MSESAERSRAEYIGRINRVLDYVQAHLGEDLALEKLADIACFSHFHFHRIFSSIVGETPADFVKRVRLESAAGRLVATRTGAITGIALDLGFGSSAAFARAFRAHFGMSASEWRSRKGAPAPAATLRVGESKNRQAKRKNRKSSASADAYSPSQSTTPAPASPLNDNRRTSMKAQDMKVEVKDLPGWRVAYARRMGPYGPETCGGAFEAISRWAGPRGLLGPKAVSIGISLDDPSVTPPAKCRYDACVVVDEKVQAEGEIGIQTLPGGKYALYRTRCGINGFGQAWNDAYGVWLPQSGYQCDERPCFELYHDCQEKGMYEFSVCIPVKPL